MCAIVFDEQLENGDAGNQQELVDAYLGGDPSRLVLVSYGDGIVNEYSPKTCLCPVDVEATLKAAGLQVEYDPFGWRVVRKNAE